jgi:predicted nucleotide-binding protein
MARLSRTTAEDPEPRLKQPVVAAQELLQDRVRRGEALLSSSEGWPSSSAEALQELRDKRYSWGDYNEELLRSLFANPDRLLHEYGGGPMIAFGGGPEPLPVQVAQFRRDVQRDVRRLTSIIERLPLFESPAESPPVSSAAAPAALRVFVVHGHNESARLAVVRFLENASTNFSVHVLSEAVNRGRTIIEIFEGEAGSATFAVVLLTGDDEGGPKVSTMASAGKARTDKWHLRARQNVVLELGYFFGKLGRGKVVILYEEGVELPSDVQGIAYIPLDDNGGWMLKLEKELRAAGHHLDLTSAP